MTSLPAVAVAAALVVTGALVPALVGRALVAARRMVWRLMDARAAWRGLAVFLAAYVAPAVATAITAACYGAQGGPVGSGPLLTFAAIWGAARAARRCLPRYLRRLR
ncbi:hypothetical protein [Actinokineospora terrae]|uniref:Uncharacterized protein n=1 Tax=Actinokineospora terrae TaxID=155974 RepID=A0A1H9M842_9PSEU|nr:hypothetical protein [Actinokineospora terrae]SER19874.1 hypothetical protein SAMN04487818_10216 [Actinokineospora terrae]